MGLLEIAEAARAAREAERAARVDAWEATIADALDAATRVRQDDVLSAAEAQKLKPELAWVTLNEHMPAGTLEAWVDVEGVLDVEVPRDIARDLVARVEAAAIRCGLEFGSWPDRAVLHLAFFRAPPTPEELTAAALTPEQVAALGGSPDEGGGGS